MALAVVFVFVAMMAVSVAFSTSVPCAFLPIDPWPPSIHKTLRLSLSADKSFTTTPSLGQKERKEQERQQDYETRRQLWASRYGSLEALRKTFGTNQNKLWGDLDPESTRQLYHTLLPRSLLALHEAGLRRPDELAPLAYQARVAAKEYARERSVVPGRMIAIAFDGYRSLRDHGKLNTKGVSWEQLWDKYEAQIVEEECVRELDSLKARKGGDEEESLTTRVYLRILERSCATNRAFDHLFLKNDMSEEVKDLTEIAAKLENDVRELLLSPKEVAKVDKKREKAEQEREKVERKAEKEVLKLEKKQEEKAKKLEKKAEKAKRKQRQKFQPEEEEKKEEQTTVIKIDERNRRARSVMLILAHTRRKFRGLQR